jgi:hypothetical protein
MSRHNVALAGAIAVSVLVMAMEGLTLWWVLVHQVEAEQAKIVMFVAGNVNAMALAVVGYWVGSSSGSLLKTQTPSGAVQVKEGGG